MSVQESGIEAEDSELSGEELREQHLMASKLKRLREARGLTRAELVAMEDQAKEVSRENNAD